MLTYFAATHTFPSSVGSFEYEVFWQCCHLRPKKKRLFNGTTIPAENEARGRGVLPDTALAAQPESHEDRKLKRAQKISRLSKDYIRLQGYEDVKVSG